MNTRVVVGLALLVGAALVGTPSPASAELKVGLGGFMRLDVVQTDKLFGASRTPGIKDTPLDTDEVKDKRETVLDARGSRLRVNISGAAEEINFTGLVEAEFTGSDGDARTSNSRGLRLRHAFARADHPSGFSLLAGQFWSLFSNIVTVPPPDRVGGSQAAILVARQPQLRLGYRTSLGPRIGELSFEADVEKQALENLGSTAVDESQGGGQDIPLFVGKVLWLHPIFRVEAAGAAGSNRVVLDDASDDRDTAWGVQASAAVKISQVTLAGHYDHLNGLQRLAGGRFPSVFLVGADVRNVESDAWYAGLTYRLTKATSFNFLYGWEKADEIPVAFTGTRQKEHRSIQVNVLHNFWQQWRVGLEYLRFDVEAFNGTEGDANIVQGALWFFF